MHSWKKYLRPRWLVIFVTGAVMAVVGFSVLYRLKGFSKGERLNRWAESHGGSVDFRNWSRKWRWTIPLSDELYDSKLGKRLQRGEPIAIYFGNSPSIAPEELRILSAYPNLRAVFLDVSTLTDSHLQVVAEAKQIDWLRLEGTSISDAGVSALVNLTDLKNLTINGCNITDGAIDALLSLDSVTRFEVSRTKITEQGLHRLAGKPKLTTLLIGEGMVKDLESFRQTFPTLEIMIEERD